jgi:hypothetical protein
LCFNGEVLEVSGHYWFIFVVTNMFPTLFFYAPMRRDFLNLNNFLFGVNSLKMINFCKNATCPPSQSLLAFQKGEIHNDEEECISQHLDSCEFCAAEVEFYARFPQSEAPCPETNIPAPLFQLAEALLSNRQKNFTLLNRLLGENESLKFEKA